MTQPIKRSKVMFVINSLEGGGAERVISIVAREFALMHAQLEVQFVTLDNEEDKYVLPAQIKRIKLDSKGGLLSSCLNLKRVLVRERPDAAIAFLTRSNLAAAALGRLYAIPVIISERVNTSSHFATRRAAPFFKAMIRALYPIANKVICVSDGVRNDLAENFGIPRERLVTAHNPVDIAAIKAAGAVAPALALPENFLVSVGRLMPNKNHELLIRAVARSRTNFNLVILGEGPDRKHLENLTESLGLKGRVLLPGHVANPHAIVARSKAYVSTSLAEGFPNALVEAMCLGRPVISTDCDSGPSEILDGRSGLKVDVCTQAQYGILVPTSDEGATANALELLSDPAVRSDYAKRAEGRASDFGMEAAVRAYSEIIFSVMGNSTGRSVAAA